MKKFARYIVACFLLMAFTLTCNFMLFFSYIDMTPKEVRFAALITFGNMAFMALLFGIADYVRRQWTVKRPVKRIQEGIDKIIGGDFHTEIKYLYHEGSENEFDQIISGLNKMAKELQGVETLRTDFISNVSHEMKTPLAVIQNYGTLLQTPGLTVEKRVEYAKAINDQTRRMSSLITNILKLNKLENQQIYPNMQKYDLGEQLCECMLSFENDWEKKDIEIDADIAEDIIVNADPEMMSLVWNNLLSNAIKFTEEGGKVGLYLRTEGDQAVISVSDTGCGMSAETGRNIFQKFYQGDTSHATQGNGLGLALVKRVIDISGATISVSSKLGEGSTFTVIMKREINDTDKNA
ncbi:MAG: HAMP domain-containing histidine kinase [Lachnospiraceae bacterium]|nr:HAMP domain-containing histidine kinase [Lachnospiraceae bacterium]